MPSWSSPSPDPDAEQALRRRLGEASCRARIAHVAAAAGSQAELGERVSAELCEALEAELSFLVACPQGGGGRVIGATGLTAEQADRVPRDCAATYAGGVSIAWARPEPVPGHLGALAALDPAALALVACDGRSGGMLLAVARLYEQPFDEAELALIESVAQTAASAHERLQLWEEDEHRTAALRESEQRYRLLAENSTDWISRHAGDGSILYCSPACQTLTGYDPAELTGRYPRELVHPDDVQRLRTIYADLLALPEAGSVAYRLRRKDGTWTWLESTARAVRDPVTDRLLELQASTRDVSGRVQAEQELRLQGEIFRNLTEGVVLVRTRDRQIVYANRRFEQLFGYDAGELTGRPVQIVNATVEPDPLEVATEIQSALVHDSQWSGEVHNLRKDGSSFWSWANVSTFEHGEHGEVSVAVHTDITERKRFEGQLLYLADHDPLTGLLNRRRFDEELERELTTARRYGTGGAVLVLDLDNFKYVNDSFGHAAGDQLITRIGRLLDGRLRESDVLARLGGDEFAAVLPRADERRARAVAAGLVEAIRSQGATEATQGSHRVSASVGIALFAGALGEVTGEQLLVEADIAMYDAKEGGRDRVAAFDPAGGHLAGMAARLSWVDRIREALDGDRFVLHAQPILSLNGDGRARHELLLRMKGPDGELIAPGAFLHIAERFGLIGEVDRWVLSRAIALLAERQHAGHRLVLDVNLSARSIADPELPGLIAAELAAAGADPSGLVFEVTESAAILDVGLGKLFAERLHELGCGFALDGFGAGFASFYCLKHLACDYLKVDGEFVRDLRSSPTNQLVVQSVVALARGLGKRTIAEFVGDPESLELLRRYGVDYAQGFYIGEPAPLDKVDLGAGLRAPHPPSAHRPSATVDVRS